MTGDLEALEKSGGFAAANQMETLVITAEKKQTSKKLFWLWLMIIIAGILVLFGVGYYYLPMFFSKNAAVQAPSITAPASAPSASADSAKTVVPEPTPVFSHHSYFRTPADAELTFHLADPGSASSSQLRGLAPLIAATTSTFSEIIPKDEEDGDLTWQDFLDRANVNFTGTLWSKFEDDFTFGVLRSKTGSSSPAYVLKVKQGSFPVLLQPAVALLENQTSSFAGLFIDPPGNPVSKTFFDIQISGQPVRGYLFSSRGAEFLYGWAYDKYLVLAGSEEAFKAALLKL